MKRIILGLALLLISSLAFAAPTCVQGAPGVAPTATLSFPPVTLNTDGTAVSAPVSYNVFMGTASGAEVLLKSGITSPATINTGLLANTTYYFFVVAIDALATQGGNSNEVCKSFPKSVPGTVVLTIT
jgi:hypothetical protein